MIKSYLLTKHPQLKVISIDPEEETAPFQGAPFLTLDVADQAEDEINIKLFQSLVDMTIWELAHASPQLLNKGIN